MNFSSSKGRHPLASQPWEDPPSDVEANALTPNAGQLGDLMTPDEFARYLGVHRKTLDKVRRANPDFPEPLRIGPGTTRYLRHEIVAFVIRLSQQRRRQLSSSDAA